MLAADDQWMGEAVAQALSRGLAQHPGFVEVERAGLDPSAWDEAAVRALATQADVMLFGRISQKGADVVVEPRLLDVKRGQSASLTPIAFDEGAFATGIAALPVAYARALRVPLSNHRSSSISWITLGCAFVGVLYATAGCALMTMQSSTPTGTFYLTNASVAHRTIADARLGIFVREHVSLAGAANLAICLYNLTNEPIEVEIESIRGIDYSGKPGIQTLQPRSTLRLPIIKINVGSAYGIAYPVMSFRIGDNRYKESFIVRARRYDWEWQAVIHNPSIPDSVDEYLRLPDDPPDPSTK